MVNAPNFPEGFRAGYELRGFSLGRARFPLSPGEMDLMADIRGRIACVLGECGFPEAARVCESRKGTAGEDLRATVEVIVRSVLASRP